LQPERRDTEDGVQVEREREMGCEEEQVKRIGQRCGGYNELIGKPQPHLFSVT